MWLNIAARAKDGGIVGLDIRVSRTLRLEFQSPITFRILADWIAVHTGMSHDTTADEDS